MKSMAYSTTGVVQPRMYWAVLRYDNLASGAIMRIAGRARWRDRGTLCGGRQAGLGRFIPRKGSPLASRSTRYAITEGVDRMSARWTRRDSR
jgi:hypothetical protein